MFQEPFLQQRIEKAKKKAEKIISGQGTTEDDIVMQFRFMLSQRYNIGLFDAYFEERTIDELAFEVFMWKELDRRNDPEIQKEEAMAEYKKTLDKENENGQGMFGDEQWEPIDLDAKFLEKAQKDFKGEGNA